MVASLSGQSASTVPGGLLTQGPAGAPAGVIIEKMGLLRVSEWAFTPRDVWVECVHALLSHPLWQCNTAELKKKRTLKVTCKIAQGMFVFLKSTLSWRKGAFGNITPSEKNFYFKTSRDLWDVALYKKKNPKSCDCASMKAEQPQEIVFPLV